MGALAGSSLDPSPYGTSWHDILQKEADIVCGKGGHPGALVYEEGREPDTERVQRIKDWPECKLVMEVGSFLGTMGWSGIL